MFIRSARRPFGHSLSRRTVQGLIIGLYVLFPVGCLLQLWPETDRSTALVADITGLLMIVAALICFAILAGSSLQRQAQEPDSQLDERELAQRNRAAFYAHNTFGGVVLLGVIYLSIAIDLGEQKNIHLWMPSTSEQWTAVFWNFLLLSLTLPAAFLAWSRDTPLDDEEE